MATVIAARMQLQDQVDQAIGELERAGFAREHIASFYVNPPGQHATYPIGGDRFESPDINGAVDSDSQAEAAKALRRAGMLVAVELDGKDQAQAVDVFRQCGAFNVEQAEGVIAQGEWRDFDPLSLPHYL